MLVSLALRYNLRGVKFGYSSMVRLQSNTVSASSVKDDSTSLKPFSAIPGPKPLPIIGNIMDMKRNMNRLRLYYEECFGKYGEIFKLSIGSSCVVVRDPNILEEVMRAEGTYPVRDNSVTTSMEWLFRKRSKLKPSLAFESGKRWRELRSAIGKQASPRNVQSYASGFNEIIDQFVNHIQSTRGSDGEIEDMNLPFKKLLMAISASFTFGSNMSVEANPSEEDVKLFDAIEYQLNLLSRLYGELPLFRLYKNKLSRDFTKAVQVTDTVARREVEKVYARLNSGEESETPCLLEQWLREGKLSEEDAISQSIGMFIGGIDTTANQIVFLLHAIAKHPEIQEKLYTEVKSVMGESSKPTVEQLAKMPELKRCILESFRVWPTVPVHARILKEDANLLGYFIPKNTVVFYSMYCAGRDETLFSNPAKFDPDRWRKDNEQAHAFAILPFGYGPRGCYGRRFAELELKLILAQLVYNFEMSTAMNELPLVELTLLRPGADVPIKFVERKN